jgi:hypothetical protein
VQLRARDGRAVLADASREVDPHSIALGPELAEALHEWAKVAQALERTGNDGRSVSAGLVSRRGRQLAARVATAMGAPVSYLDPLTGEVTEVDVPPPMPSGRPRHQAPDWSESDEPTPWATGLTVSAFTTVVVTFAVVALSFALGSASNWLAAGANVVIAIGLAPSVLLARRVPVWRWIAFGVVAGLGIAWIVLLLSLL